MISNRFETLRGVSYGCFRTQPSYRVTVENSVVPLLWQIVLSELTRYEGRLPRQSQGSPSVVVTRYEGCVYGPIRM